MPRRRELDERDRAILAHRDALYWQRHTGPRVGDYVDFADGVTQRVSHVWDLGEHLSIQTSDSGSWYLGEGYCSFSGGLHSGLSSAALTYVDHNRLGWVWFFHHGDARADNGVYAEMPFAVYRCDFPARKES